MKTTMYDMSEAPKYIVWERLRGKPIYFEPLIIKHENEGHSDAYLVMYARLRYRNGKTHYRPDDYLFRVEGMSLAEALDSFEQRLQLLQETELIQGRQLCADKVTTMHRNFIDGDIYYKLRKEYFKLISE